MIKKLLFKKKKNRQLNIIILFFIFIIFFFYIYLNYYHKKELFIILKNNTSFYITPKDKEGKLIPNIEKRILNLQQNKQNEIIINEFIKYSIQLFASTNYEETINKLNIFSNKETLNDEDFYIIVFNHSIGTDYLLLYKNFNYASEAKEYCTKYLNFIENCLIVNVENLK